MGSLMWIRNDMGSQYCTIFVRWRGNLDRARASELVSPVSPASIKAHPQDRRPDGDLERSSRDRSGAREQTNASLVAISEDEERRGVSPDAGERSLRGCFAIPRSSSRKIRDHRS